jgi:hypothetical protein
MELLRERGATSVLKTPRQRSLRGGAIEVNLPLIEEEGQAQGDPDEARRGNGEPAAAQPETPSLEFDKKYEGERRAEDVEAEEATYTVRK